MTKTYVFTQNESGLSGVPEQIVYTIGQSIKYRLPQRQNVFIGTGADRAAGPLFR
jgi:hypothetical protein